MNNAIINEIKIELYNYINSHINNISRPIDFHYYLQMHIAALARMYGYRSIIEYHIPKGNTFSKFIDVVWVDKYKNIAVAIEIDSCLRTKSIKKLYNINAENKIWVLYCNNLYTYEFDNLMSKYNKNKEINIIYLGAIRQCLRKRLIGKNKIENINLPAWEEITGINSDFFDEEQLFIDTANRTIFE